MAAASNVLKHMYPFIKGQHKKIIILQLCDVTQDKTLTLNKPPVCLSRWHIYTMMTLSTSNATDI